VLLMRHLNRMVVVPFGVNILGLLELFALIGAECAVGALTGYLTLRVSQVPRKSESRSRAKKGRVEWRRRATLLALSVRNITARVLVGGSRAVSGVSVFCFGPAPGIRLADERD
jgi:hypothetical protein